MTRPALKQFGDFSAKDFEQNAVWVACHVLDYEEPWYEETDEGTFRPWNDALPVNASNGMLLVRTKFVLADCSELTGFPTPAFKANDIGAMQPQVFVDDHIFGFWGGMVGIAQGKRNALYSALGKTPSEVFPVQFEGDKDITDGICSGRIEGFYSVSDGRTIRIEQ